MDNILTGIPEGAQRLDANVAQGLDDARVVLPNALGGKDTDEERIAKESFVGRAGGISYEQFLTSRLPQSKYVPGEEPKRSVEDNNLEAGKWETFVSNANKYTNATLTGFSHLVYKNFIGPEEGYNPYKDPTLLEQSPEFQIKYARDFMDSPNARYTAGLIERTKQNEEMLRRTANNPGSALGGAIVGSLVDPVNLSMLRVGMAGETALARALNTGAASALSASVQGEAMRQYDPTVTQEEVALNTGTSFLLGAALGSIGGGYRQANFSDKGLTGLREIISVEDRNSGKTLSQVLDETGTAGAAAVKDISGEGYALAETNALFKGMHKGLNIGAELDGLTSPSKKTNYITNVLTAHNYRTEGSLKGQAIPVSIFNVADAEVQMGLNPLRNRLDDAYASFKKEGGKLEQEAFVRESLAIHGGISKTSSRAMSEGASAWTDFFKHYADRNSSIDANFKPRTKYIPAQYSREAVIKHSLEVRADITEELLRRLRFEESDLKLKVDAKGNPIDFTKDPKYIPPDIEDARFDNAVKQIYEDMVINSSGRYDTAHINKFTNNNLKPRVNNFSNEFYMKYMEPDTMAAAVRYAKTQSRSLASQRLLGSSDPYVALDMIRKDYGDMQLKIGNRPDVPNSKELAVNLQKSMETDLENTKNLIDMFTGVSLQNYSRLTRDTSAIVKSLVYFRTMGQPMFSMMTDLARVARSHLDQVGFTQDILDHAKLTADTFKAIPDASTGRLYGVVADKMTGVSRSSMFAETIDIPVETKIERGTRAASQVFSKLNLMDPINNVTRKMVGEDVSRKILKLSRDLVDGKLQVGDSNLIELNKLGVDDSLAKKIIGEFDKHQEVTMVGNKKVLTTGIDNWDPNIASYYIAAVQKAVNNTIIVPTAGAKPFWTNTPYGSIISQFRSFTLTSINKYLLPAAQDISGVSGQARIKVLSVIMADLLLASQVQAIKDLANGKEVNYTPEGLMASTLTKNATFAILGLGDGLAAIPGYGIDQVIGKKPSYYFDEVDYAKGIVGQVAGPGARYGFDIFDNIYDANKGNYSDSEYRRTLQLAPGQNLLYWSWAINQIGRKQQQPQNGNKF